MRTNAYSNRLNEETTHSAVRRIYRRLQSQEQNEQQQVIDNLVEDINEIFDRHNLQNDNNVNENNEMIELLPNDTELNNVSDNNDDNKLSSNNATPEPSSGSTLSLSNDCLSSPIVLCSSLECLSYALTKCPICLSDYCEFDILFQSLQLM